VSELIYIGGFSGGIDSQAAARFMLNRYGAARVVLVNSDAGGNEHPLTIEHIDWYSANVHPVVRVQAIVRDMWMNPETAAARGLDPGEPLTFARMAEIRGIFPSRKRQFCTDKLKLQPISRWLRAAYPDGNYARFSGVRRDESQVRANRQWLEWDDFYDCDLYNPVYDWSKQMCFEYVKHHGETINPLYTLGFTRVGCAPCVNSNKGDILNWTTRFPEMIDKVRAWEHQVGRTFFAPCVPGMAINWIDDVVAWAKTDRGGRQNNMFRILPPPACESRYGLCE
jgi:3'-phosphoadenosine 5'-phosphosulfate sulfotransferase (PAPS reductase)/FAD synthetase